MKICSELNFIKLAEAISRIEHYIGLKDDVDFNTISGQLKSINTYTAGVELEAFKVVRMNVSNKVEYANFSDINNSENIIGFTLEAANLDASVKVQSFGYITNANWNFDLNKPIMLGENGDITQVCPTSGFWMKLGTVISPTEILVNISMPIFIK